MTITSALMNGLADVLHVLWEVSWLWEGLTYLGLLASLWLALRNVIDPDGEDASRPVKRPSARATGGLGTGEAIVLAALTLAGLCIRLHGRKVLPYWWDELLAVWAGQAPVPVMLRSLFSPETPASDFTPPLFYLLLHGWFAVAGIQEASARIFTACLSAAAIPLAGLVGRRLFSQRVGLTAAFLLCISPPAIFYAQQTRSYALLSTLALASVLAVDRARRDASLKNLAALCLTGTLFLYTHYVAAWLWLGIAAAAWLGEVAGAFRFRMFRAPRMASVAGKVGAVAAVAGLAYLCPLFHPPLLRDMRQTWGVWLAGALVLAVLAGRSQRLRPGCGPDRPDGGDFSHAATCGPDASSMRRLAGLTAAFVLPAVLLSLWMLPSGVLKVLGGAGSRVPGSYGFPEFAAMFAQFSGIPATLSPSTLDLGLFLALCGLFLACVERPRQAALILGWTGFPMAVSMAMQHPAMNLVRYLLAAMPGVLLLEAVALEGACRGLAVLLRGSSRRLPSRLTAVAACAAPLFLAAAIIGYRAFVAWPLPTTRTDFENFTATAARLSGQPDFMLAGESHNLVRALSWYLDRMGRRSISVKPESPRYSAVNVFLDGRFWHTGEDEAMDLSHAAPISGNFGEIALYEQQSAAPATRVLHPDGAGGWNITLDARALRDKLLEGSDVAWIGGNTAGLAPLFKNRPGRAIYRTRLVGGGDGRLAVSARGIIAGPESYLRVRLRQPGQLDWSGWAVLHPDGKKTVDPEGGNTPSWTVAANGDSEAVFPLQRSGKPDDVDVEVELFDDCSGVIYSSNAVLRSLTLRLEP